MDKSEEYIKNLNSSTGLRRGLVEIVPYRSEWATMFLAEAERIKAYAGDIAVQIEHVGSTSVRSMVAKPIIDIAIAVESRHDLLLLVERLLNAGYIDGGDQGESGGYLVERDSKAGVRILHIHIVEKTDVQWRNYIAFRDCLRRDKGIQD
jgi:GrpB-like predicted nucleotidyltransferase (UPF0157 family)